MGVDGGADHLRSLLSVKETLSARHTRHHIIEMYWQNRIGKHNVSCHQSAQNSLISRCLAIVRRIEKESNWRAYFSLRIICYVV